MQSSRLPPRFENDSFNEKAEDFSVPRPWYCKQSRWQGAGLSLLGAQHAGIELLLPSPLNLHSLFQPGPEYTFADLRTWRHIFKCILLWSSL